jgi:hypothetical protein
MTPRQLEAKSDAQLRLLAAWTADARKLIDSKVSDAKAHAVSALTDTLKWTPDGRRTIRKASRSPSYAAAVRRLSELWEALCGPSTASLDGLVRDAREAFYFDAFARWGPHVPDEFRVQVGSATLGGRKAARGMVLHGIELRRELGAPIERARRTLLAAVTLAAGRSTPTRIQSEIVSTWARKGAGAIFAATRLALSDSLVACDSMALRDLVRPEFRDGRVATPGGV